MTQQTWLFLGRFAVGAITLVCAVLGTYFAYLQVNGNAPPAVKATPPSPDSSPNANDEARAVTAEPARSVPTRTTLQPVPSETPETDDREVEGNVSTGTSAGSAAPKIESLPDPKLAQTFCAAGVIAVTFEVKPEDHIRHRVLGGSLSHHIQCAADQRSFQIVNGERPQDGPGGVFSRNGLSYTFSYVAKGVIITCRVSGSRASTVPLTGTISCDRPEGDVSGRTAIIGI
jgi:hypothetical protein